MPVSAETIRQHLDYSAWASQRLVDEALKLTPDELRRDFQTSDRSVLDTLVHVYAADRIWLARVKGEHRDTFVDPADRDMDVLVTEWPALHQRWKRYAQNLSDQDVLANISYKDTKGNAWSNSLWQILLHLVNHGTHHRGQVAGFLRSMGHPPPALDLIVYYRTY